MTDLTKRVAELEAEIANTYSVNRDDIHQRQTQVLRNQIAIMTTLQDLARKALETNDG